MIILGLSGVPPMVISIWCENSKPIDFNEYLKPFISEMLEVLKTGISINNFKIIIEIGFFVCDSPARAILEGEPT